MRQAVAQATHHTAHRSAFGKLLSEQPLMINVLADLAIESEATTLLMMRLAGACDRAAEPQEAAFRRLALAVAKYWTTKRSIAVVAEALECHGGNGYVEESIMPRLYREAPLNSIWEGSGNVNALDVLRAMAREPESVDAFVAEAEEARGSDPKRDDRLEELKRSLSDSTDAESRARRIVEQMAVVLEASLLVRHGDPAVAEAFCASRLGSNGSTSFGTLTPSRQLAGIVRRHRPQV
jgi:putative acyl-CoA dehydrogenase